MNGDRPDRARPGAVRPRFGCIWVVLGPVRAEPVLLGPVDAGGKAALRGKGGSLG